MSLVKELIKGLLPEEEGKKSIGVFGGGFKPPTKGHFEVLKKALDENPEIDEMLVFIGKGERDGITQEESLKIWEIYGRYLPFKVQYIKSTKPPIQLIYNTAKENPESEVLWIIGAREENEDDFKDIASRTSGITKYPNLELRTIVTKGGVSGTAARNAAKVSKEKLDDFLPEFLSEKEKQDIFVMLSNTVTENYIISEADPKKGTGKKPKNTGRRLYTDEDPSDTVKVKFSTRQDIVDTLNKTSFKSKSHARQSQVINLIHQRVRAAYERAKDPEVKKRLKTALDYAEQRKEASKEKTERLKKQKLNEQKQDMKFKVPKLNYSYTSLQPYIDKETMEEHFDKHFKGYTDKLNAELDEKSIRIEAEDQIQAIQIILGKYSKNDTIRNNGGGFYNHVLYFENMTPDYKSPSTKFRKMLEENFNSFSEFKEQFKEAGLKQFGSGWAFLIKKGDKLVIESYANQDNPYLDKDFKGKIIIAMDVWEHSYYLKHKSQRGNYIDDFFRVVDYKIAEERLEEEPITENVAPNHDGKAAPYGSGYDKVKEGDTIEKYSAIGKKTGKLKQGTVRARLNIPKDEKIPMYKINKELARLKKMDQDDDKAGVQLGDKNQKYYKALQLAKTLKSTTNINENASYSQHIDIKKEIGNLIKHMLDKGMNIQPLPKLVFKNGDSENAKQFLGKTAYYDPNSMSIVLYTEGRHPKDIVRSFSHEMVHHTQNLEGRLGDVSTTNTMEDDHLDKLEQEANLTGTMTFRNWTDSLNENLTKSSNYLYHWTSYSACKKILESNKLKSNKSNQFFEYDESRDLPDYKNVVFFTVENERFADEENSNQCILVVDKSKLSKDYKVISYGDPYEETVVYTNDPSISVLPYLKGVILMNTLQKSAVKKMEEFLESKGIPYEINDKLEREVKAKQAKLPTLKKELINKLKLKYPNGFIGYLNKPLFSYQTPEYFKNNSTYSYPNITINKPGEYGKKNKFQVKFKIESQNLEKYINWYMYSPDSIEDLINMDNYEGENLWLKGDIPINSTTLQEANLTGTMTFRNWTDSLNESFYLDIPKFSQPKTLQHYLIENINEISLSKENAVDINGDLTGGTFTVGDITYEYSIKNIPNPYKDLGLFYNIQFTPSGEVTSIPKGGKENYIKILSTIYKIIVDFIEKEKPEYVGISSLDNSGDKNYHTVYNRLTTNNLNLIPGYFRKDSNLTFDSPQGKGRFIVLKKKDDLNEKKTKDPFGINAYAMELGRLREEETEYKIYVDMDGVVADFDQRFRDLAGIGPREFEEKYGKNAFWDFIDEGDNKLVFWVGIPPMSDAKQLIDYVSKYDYEMLTAPSLKKQSLMGKGLWMKNQTNKGLFPSKPKVNYRSAKSKKDFAAPNHILIDDREDTINSWNAAGGIGILHTSAANTINQLKKLGL
jgi:Fe-Mn family superoxide dismutase